MKMPKYDFLKTLYDWSNKVSYLHSTTTNLGVCRLSPEWAPTASPALEQLTSWLNDINTNQVFCFCASVNFEYIVCPEINRFIDIDPFLHQAMVFIYRPENQTEESFFIEHFSLMQTIGAGHAAFIERDIDMHDIVRNYEILKGQVKEKETLVW